ncbi:MAG: hypothetical protein JNK30_04745 [Phenylobacterium sp.]|uniref:hypothetical protein n=1 Tax=Phenylobacterium sp. TaxID=1871053 RepID=UPI001A507A5E|nr:hypothetical protein [Phenylobacterium sp.]MBL8770668.1 hypothetical protein [Phenylobacterium sp.]
MTTKFNPWSLTSAWLLAASLIAVWVWPKFIGLEIHPIFGWAEARSGVGWLEPNGRYAVGVLAGALAVMLLIRRTRLVAGWAALGLSLVFTLLHLTPWLGINIPDYGPLMESLAAGRSVAEIEALGLKGDRGAHFTFAIINAGLAAMVVGAEMVKPAAGRRQREYTPMQLGAS